MNLKGKKDAKVVICGAGIAGISSAYFLAVKEGVSDIVLVDERAPLSLTSDKSTECYRNWWPGPGNEMVGLMNRSIDLMEEMARKSGNIFHMNRRGYLYVTRNKDLIKEMRNSAEEARELGAGELRTHEGQGRAYRPHPAEGFEDGQDGADLLLGGALIQAHFPYLSSEVVAALHVRRAGWLSAQQYGMWMLEQARKAGVQVLRARVREVRIRSGKVQGVVLESGESIEAPIFINAAGPMLAEAGEMLGVEIPVYNELHLKSGFKDSEGVIGRDAPLVISADGQKLKWSNEDAQMLSEDEDSAWLLRELPSGAHARPEGAIKAKSILVLWDLHTEKVEAKFPPEMDPLAAEMAIRGLVHILPGMQKYVEKMPRPFVDGGYYTKTEENRPLAGRLAIEGAFVIGAASGYGIMAAAGLGELLAAHVNNSLLPDYASAFSLDRYQDPDYQALLENWGSSWQL